MNEGYYYKYDLQKGKEKYFATLKKGNTYYFYIKAEEGNELEIELSMDYSSVNSFSSVYANEYSSRYSTSKLHYSSIYLSSFNRNGKTVFSTTYSVWDFDAKYVALEITPNYDVSNFSILINVSGISNTTVILLAVFIPVFCCFFFIVVIFVIICRKRRNNIINSNANKTLNIPTQPLYMNPEVQYAPPQTQYAPQYQPTQPLYPPQPQYAPIQPQGNQQYLAPGQLYQ